MLLLRPLRRGDGYSHRLFAEPLGACSFRDYVINTAGAGMGSAALATPLFSAASQMVRPGG